MTSDITEWFVIGLDDTSDNTDEESQTTQDLLITMSTQLSEDGWGLFEGLTVHPLFGSNKIQSGSSNSCYAVKLWTTRSALDLEDELVSQIRSTASSNSDPGLAMLSRHSDMPHILAFGRRTQTELMRSDWAQTFSTEANVTMRSLGVKRNGCIGALAACGLRAGGDELARFRTIPGLEDMRGHHRAGDIRDKTQLQHLLNADDEEIDMDDTIDLGDGLPVLKPHLESHEPVIRLHQDPSNRRLWIPDPIFFR